MPLSNEDVEWSVRILLGRAPKDAAEVAFLARKFRELGALRRHLMTTREFMHFYARVLSRRAELEGTTGLEFARERLIFLHIPKNAGSTMRQILEAHFDRSEIFPEHAFVAHYPASFIARHRLFRGHFPLSEIAHIPGPRFVFTVLREPRARILSQYRYHQAMAAQDAPAGRRPVVDKARLPLKQYLRDPDIRRHISVDNMQTRFLFQIGPDMVDRLPDDAATRGLDAFNGLSREAALQVAIENLERLDAVGVVEQFDEFVAMLLEGRGLPVPDEYKRVNVTSELAAARARTEAEEPDAEVQALLDELVSLDEVLYARGRDLFREQLRAHLSGAAPAPPPKARLRAVNQ